MRYLFILLIITLVVNICNGVVLTPVEECTIQSIEPTSQSISSAGGTLIFEMHVVTSSSCALSFTGTPSWMAISYSKLSDDEAEAVVTVQANSSSARSATITVKVGSTKKSFTVTQSAMPYITLSPTSLSFSCTGGSKTFTVSTNTTSQTVTYSGCVSSATLSGSTVTVTCAANSTTSAKTGTVTVSGNGISSSVSVSQEASYITLSPTSLSFSCTGGSKTFTVSTNTTSQTVTYSGCVSSATLSGSTVTVTCAANSTTTAKTGTVTVSGNGISSSVSVSQEASYITLSPTSLSFSCTGGSKTFTVSTNTTSQTVTYSGCVSSATLSGSTVTVTCAANSTTTAKTGTVTVSGNGISSSVSVSQEASYITLSPTSLSFSCTGGSKTFTVSTNTTSQTVTYSGCVSSATLSGSTVTVTCAANSTTSAKTGTVTVSGNGISSSVSVSQEASYITLSPTSLSFSCTGGSKTFTISTNTTGQAVTYSGCVSSATLSGSTVTVTCAANSTTTAKTGTVTVSGNGISSSVSVSQEASYIALSPTSLSFEYTGGNKTFTVSTNTTSQTITYSGCVSSATLSGSTVTVTCAANSTTSAKTGTVTVSGNGINSSVSVTLAAMPYITLSPTSLSFSCTGGSKTFTISTNTTGQAVTYSGCVSSATLSGSTVTVTCVANSTTSAKTGTVTVSGNGISSSVSVSQEASYITLSPTSLSFEYTGGNKTFTVSTNTTSQTVTYSGCVSSATLSGSTVTVTCAANSTTTAKTGTVTVSGNGINSSVSVTLAAMPYITLSPTSLSYTYAGGSKTFTVSTNTTSQTVTYTGCVSSATLSGSTVTVTCAANSTTSAKTGIVTVNGGGISSSVNVTQTAVPYITLTPTSLRFDYTGGSQTFSVNTNTTNQTVTYSGCVYGATLSGSTVTVTCAANGVSSSITGTVTVSGGGISSIVNVSQRAKPASPSQDRNYILRETILEKGQQTESATDTLDYTQKRTRVEYYDGLGRLSQVVDFKASGGGSKDLITPVIYDEYGRQAKDYLPFASAQDAAYLSTATVSDNWTGYYGSTDGIYAYSEKTYDNSPLNRVVEQSAPGETWKTGNGHTVKYAYGTNTSSEVMDYTINNSTNLLNTTASAYAASTLYKTTTWDENVTTPTESANRTVEYKDKQGRVVLKRSYIGTTAYSTYYVYNDKGLLCCVIPPKATADDGSISSTELSQLCYQYLYDGRDRLIEKKLPGAGWAYMVYDQRDRLVLSQSAVQRANGYWLFSKYDAFNRAVLTGKYESSLSRTSLQTTVDAETVMYESSGSVVLGYTNNAFPRISDAGKYLSATYYDSYTTPSTWGYSYSQVYSTETRTDNVKGQVTGIRAKIPDTGTWLYTVNYYDKYGRLLQQYQTNPEGGNNRVSYSYNFVGQVTTKQTLHKKTSSSTAITLNESFTYDHMGRQLTCKFGYNTTTLTTLATNTYDDLGRLSTKQQHNGLQYCDYSYNIRGWLTKINDPGVASTTARLFAMQLYYDTDMTTTLNGTAQYNGNINGIKWRQYNSGSNLYKGYNFTYDGLNRLTQGDYGTYSGSWTNSSAYDLTSAAYDANGNITGLTRKNSSGSNRESLTYTNTGNQLGTVSGTYEGTSGKSGSYSYDSNGNLTSDGLRGLTISYYKELDLPSQYYKDASNKVVYQYDALGVKWGKTATISGSSATTLYYGPFIYQGGSLVKVLTPEGYYVPDPTTPLYHYYLKDHLGNTRMTYHYSGSNPTVDQEEEYYPFGSLFTDNNLTENKYLYNGKELQDEFFENYDYGARFYDAEIGRWHVIDNKAEKYYGITPYAYALNNPVRLVDPDGNTVWDAIVGTSIGIVTNIVPGTTHLRNNYTPTDAGDYNNALRSTDAAAMTVGQAMEVGGHGTAATGGVVLVAAGTVEVATAGAGTVVAAPAAVIGGTAVIAGEATALGGKVLQANAANNAAAGYNYGETKGESKGSLSGTKEALKEAKGKIGLESTESLPKGETGKFGSPQRGNSQKGYRLDPAHPNAKPGSGEEKPHINYWDYTKGKRGNGGVSGAIPIEN